MKAKNKMDVNIENMRNTKFIHDDNRLTPGLDPSKQFLDDNDRPKNKCTLKMDDFKTSEIETYESTDDVFRLFIR